MRRLICILPLILFYSCAGPTNPFGGDIFISEKFELNAKSKKGAKVNLHMYPARQYYNSPYDLSIKIKDPNFVISKFRYDIVYNHRKLNRWFKSEEIKFPKNKDGEIEIVFKNLSILPGNINKIAFLYYPAGSKQPIVHKLEVPECLKEQQDGDLFISPFKVTENLKQSIKSLAGQYKYNPSLIAALIAQESSFKTKAISKAWALGLTQVTPTAHQEIKKFKAAWDIYPEFEDLSLRTIKNYLKENKINAGNDWRLDNNKSIEGGILYLDYIKSYWGTPNKKEILSTTFKKGIPEVDIYLASYNSGPYRVKKSIIKNGENWLFDKSLNEARKYVMNIKSYCYAFNEGDQHEK